jgi:hypothetical protein
MVHRALVVYYTVLPMLLPVTICLQIFGFLTVDCKVVTLLCKIGSESKGRDIKSLVLIKHHIMKVGVEV